MNLPEGADGIIYRVWWMVLVNLLLKIIQPFTKYPFLVNVVSTEDDYGDPHFDGYTFKRTHCRDGYFERIKASLFSGRYADKFYKEGKMIFSQGEINDYVSLDMLLTFGVVIALAAYFIYKWIDYAIFVRRINKHKEDKPWP